MKFLAATVVACAALVLSGCQAGDVADLGAGVEESAPAEETTEEKPSEDNA